MSAKEEHHSATVATLRAAWAHLAVVPRDAATQARIDRQRHALAALITVPPLPYASAG